MADHDSILVGLLAGICGFTREPSERRPMIVSQVPGPDLGAAGAPGPGLPPTGGLPPNPSIFWLMIDVSLVILIEDFEINEN